MFPTESGSVAYASGEGIARLRLSFEAPFCFSGWYHLTGVKRPRVLFRCTGLFSQTFHLSSEAFVGIWHRVVYPETRTGLVNVSCCTGCMFINLRRQTQNSTRTEKMIATAVRSTVTGTRLWQVRLASYDPHASEGVTKWEKKVELQQLECHAVVCRNPRGVLYKCWRKRRADASIAVLMTSRLLDAEASVGWQAEGPPRAEARRLTHRCRCCSTVRIAKGQQRFVMSSGGN